MTIQIVREETCWRHMGYSFWLTARVLLYAPSLRQDSTYHSLCYTSCGALAGMKNSSMGPPWRIDPMTHRTMSEHSYHGLTSRSRNEKQINKSTMRDRSDDPSHHERMPHYRSKDRILHTCGHHVVDDGVVVVGTQQRRREDNTVKRNVVLSEEVVHFNLKVKQWKVQDNVIGNVYIVLSCLTLI